jgi:hypothetical protein
MRSLAGRDDDPALELIYGDDTALALIRRARAVF